MTAEELIAFMAKHKMNGYELCEILGVTKGAVSHWVNNRRDIPVIVARVIRMFDDAPEDMDYFKEL